ncbi:MAG: hypothetical protein K2W99_05490 [Chthoniobacterales bacterium]|nr:hypothetical protein [Chthoniobacterales bacterium]
MQPSSFNPNSGIVAEEVYAFLCDSKAVQSEPSLEKLKEDFLDPQSSAITCEGTTDHYHFSINRALWNAAITVPSGYARQLFNQWKENPTVQELCYYLNDSIRQKRN